MANKAILIFLFIAITATSIAKAQNPVGIVHVNGTLYCSADGTSGYNGNTALVFPNAVVQVACSADVIANVPVNATTNSNGVYLVVLIPRPDATVNLIVSSCRLFVLMPLSSCSPALPPRGLVSNLQFVRTVPTGFLRITYMAATGFSLQA